MATIWKFPLELKDEQFITPPKGFEILDIQLQNGIACMWILCDPKNPPDKVKLLTIGTGREFEDRKVGKYLGTYQLGQHHLVFHVFYQWIPEID